MYRCWTCLSCESVRPTEICIYTSVVGHVSCKRIDSYLMVIYSGQMEGTEYFRKMDMLAQVAGWSVFVELNHRLDENALVESGIDDIQEC
jgi:hypothetical protein